METVGRVLVGLVILAIGVWWYNDVKPGYVRNDDTLWPFDKVWQPGREHPDFANIRSGLAEGDWLALPGYAFTAAEDDGLLVAWRPNVSHPENRNVRSHSEEGMWLVRPGYRFTNGGHELQPSGLPLQTRWVPGETHPRCRHIRSQFSEGRWTPAYGYSLKYPGRSNDYTVVSSRTSVAPGRPTRVATNAVCAVAGEGMSRSEGTGIGGALERMAGRAMRDNCLDNIAREYRPARSETLIACDFNSLAWNRAPRRWTSYSAADVAAPAAAYAEEAYADAAPAAEAAAAAAPAADAAAEAAPAAEAAWDATDAAAPAAQ